MDGVGRLGIGTKEVEQATQTDEAQGSDAQAHDGTTVEGDVQCRSRAVVVGSHRRTNVSPGRRVHAQITGSCGGQGADDKGNGCVLSKGRQEDAQYQHRGKNGQHLVLPVHEHHRPKMNLVGNALDVIGTEIVPGHDVIDDKSHQQPGEPETGRQDRIKNHNVFPRCLLFPARSLYGGHPPPQSAKGTKSGCQYFFAPRHARHARSNNLHNLGISQGGDE